MKNPVLRVACGFLLSAALATSAFAADITGLWSGTSQGREGKTQQVSLTITRKGQTLSGSMTAPMGQLDVENIVVSGNKISFDIALNYQGQMKKIDYAGTIQGDQMDLQQIKDGKPQAGGVKLTHQH